MILQKTGIVNETNIGVSSEKLRGIAIGAAVGMCGEAAADPLLIPLLISFGLDEYSVNPTSLLATRKEISRWSKQEADKIAERVMALDTEKQIVSELKRYLNM